MNDSGRGEGKETINFVKDDGRINKAKQLEDEVIRESRLTA